MLCSFFGCIPAASMQLPPLSGFECRWAWLLMLSSVALHGGQENAVEQRYDSASLSIRFLIRAPLRLVSMHIHGMHDDQLQACYSVQCMPAWPYMSMNKFTVLV